MTKKMLMIIDPQVDFISGSLAVEGASSAMIDLARYIERHGDEYDVIGVSLDWHPTNHCSFKDNGGIWPPHCVQHTVGATISPEVFDAIKKAKNVFYVPFTKGSLPGSEEYSFMDNKTNIEHFKILLDEEEIEQIDVCGIALDYCVKESIIGMWGQGLGDKINLLLKYSPAIGDPKLTLDELTSKGIKLVG